MPCVSPNALWAAKLTQLPMSLGVKIRPQARSEKIVRAAFDDKRSKNYVVVGIRTIEEDIHGRADELLPHLFPEQFKSPTSAKRACRRGEVLVDGTTVQTTTCLRPFQTVQLIARASSSTQHLLHGQEAEAQNSLQHLRVVFEDEHMACIVKPQGMPTQGTGFLTVQGCLPYLLQPSTTPGALRKPCHAHRLDAPTGGLLLVAKTRAALQQLTEDFQVPGTLQKRYLAIVVGELNGSGSVDKPLGGKTAVTTFKSEHQIQSMQHGCLTKVSLWPHTGRTHQLRRHMAHLGTPILGDDRYTRYEGLEGHMDIERRHAAGTPGATVDLWIMKSCEESIQEYVHMELTERPDKARDQQSAEAEQERISQMSAVPLCLWAVELVFPHPHSRKLYRVTLSEPPVFAQTIQRLRVSL
ncbi:hypothetical protein CEUSTIGMA_g7284.t1 [Chlamydomonas eustigma]|uniref:Pseudouridine synthase RsuA/RluA-like domain-containing protein n=1 Tax=Chlamydomonas eustigma TaxID=1157962 RepID=A0A250X9U6_9CHLO|nr:hypothetical protein CEUSTIGMA_g7284.t1 [Chlamydomonas eustigma]|eukprot:GAX79844.1 hypothetical protein CEUSTIGMA_g7284.t1 [Chlamydomonas eustigma]